MSDIFDELMAAAKRKKRLSSESFKRKEMMATIKRSCQFKAFLKNTQKELSGLPQSYLLKAVDITVSGYIYIQTGEKKHSIKVFTRVFLLNPENILKNIESSVLRDLKNQLPDGIQEVKDVRLHLGSAYAWTDDEVFTLVEEYCDAESEASWMSLPRNYERPCSCYL